MISIGTLTPQDRPAWEGLFRAYNDFYETTLPQDTYDRAWTEFQASERMHALVARVDGRLAGIVSPSDIARMLDRLRVTQSS